MKKIIKNSAFSLIISSLVFSSTFALNSTSSATKADNAQLKSSDVIGNVELVINNVTDNKFSIENVKEKGGVSINHPDSITPNSNAKIGLDNSQLNLDYPTSYVEFDMVNNNDVTTLEIPYFFGRGSAKISLDTKYRKYKKGEEKPIMTGIGTSSCPHDYRTIIKLKLDDGKVSYEGDECVDVGNTITCNTMDVGSFFYDPIKQKEYKVVDNDMLRGNIDDYTAICTSHVTDMSHLFAGKKNFNQDISEWDTSNVTIMLFMFKDAEKFDQNIGEWDTSKVRDMGGMFMNTEKFNQDISKWDTSNVTQMGKMFNNAGAFNQDISSWNVDKVTNYSDFANYSAMNNNYLPKFK